MRQGIAALENRYATLQQRADQGGLGAERQAKIQNRLDRLVNMGATGMREMPQQQPQAPRPMAPQQPVMSQPQPAMQPVNDLVAHPNALPPMGQQRPAMPMQRPSLFSMYQQQGQPQPGVLPSPFGRNMFNTRRE